MLNRELAQFNVSTLREPLDHPASAGFADGIAAMNALGESSDGFVWRLQTDDGDATSLRVFPDPMTIVNLTVWRDPASLKAFAYRTEHGDFVRRRDDWFTPRQPGHAGASVALWWVPAGSRPSLDEAKARLAMLQTWGPSPWAFTFGSVREHGGGEPAGPGAGALTVHRVAPDGDGDDTSDAIALIQRLNAQLAEEYPAPGANHFRLDADEVAPGRGAFLLVRLDGEPVACGAVRLVDEPIGAAEIKRMYAIPEMRGRRLGAGVLALLEAEARSLGATSLVLETGPDSHAAIATYTRAGFVPRPAWGEYLLTPDTSACFTKPL
jgi:GNAT superfamily N-acetyltransferase